MNPVRRIVAEGVAGIIAALPDQAKITVTIEDLPREKFDLLRGDEPADFLPRCGLWVAMVSMGDDVSLELETMEPPVLRAVG